MCVLVYLLLIFIHSSLLITNDEIVEVNGIINNVFFISPIYVSPSEDKNFRKKLKGGHTHYLLIYTPPSLLLRRRSWSLDPRNLLTFTNGDTGIFQVQPDKSKI